MENIILKLLLSDTIKGNVLFCLYKISDLNMKFFEKNIDIDLETILKYYNENIKPRRNLMIHELRKCVFELHNDNIINMNSTMFFDEFVYSIYNYDMDIFKNFMHLSLVY